MQQTTDCLCEVEWGVIIYIYIHTHRVRNQITLFETTASFETPPYADDIPPAAPLFYQKQNKGPVMNSTDERQNQQ